MNMSRWLQHVAVMGASKDYAKCVSTYAWRDDCSPEFAILLGCFSLE
jgi:hypothetical protein